jgi:16S rRNA (adenine1518-N6/adenine1519-N6)-dimethyltransferase
MNLTQIKRTLESERIQLTKSLGQNLLHDANQLARIIGAADLSKTDRVLEIGPGLGALTQLLAGEVAEVLAIEVDKRFYDRLQAALGPRPGLELLHADALEYLRQHPTDWTGWKLVSNLPYSVASPILVELAKAPQPPDRLIATLQLEVAQRLAATAGTPEYGVLSLLVQVRYQFKHLFKIPPSCFFPVPDVDSACVTLVRRPAALVPPERSRAFEKIVKRGFSQRRKMMLKLLKADWPLPRLQDAFAATGISPQARAETVTLEQYVLLTNLLTQPTSSHERG